jgi:putative transcriptional regulator
MDTKKIRISAFMTQEEFAKALGVSVGTVRGWEQGIFKPSLKAQKKIVEFCKKNGVEL